MLLCDWVGGLISLLFLVWVVFAALGFGASGYVVWFELRFAF